MLRARRAARRRARSPSSVALNDVVITQGALSRIIDLSVSVGERVRDARQGRRPHRRDARPDRRPTTCRPAGPSCIPAVDALVLTPIAPHTLTNRPVVIPASAEVRRPAASRAIRDEVFVTFDGQAGFQLQAGDVVEVAAPSAAAARSSLRRALLRGAPAEAEVGGTVAGLAYLRLHAQPSRRSGVDGEPPEVRGGFA